MKDFNVVGANEALSLSGDIIISERLPMNIEIELSFTSCSLDRVRCTSLKKISVPKICEKMATNTSIAYRLTRGILPTLKCPIAAGTYHLMMTKNISLVVSLLPLEAYLFVIRAEAFEKNSRKRVRPLACAEFDVSIPHKSNADRSKGRK